ncbi:hypothetical protein QBC44DRAFT_83098 [Cladorrhinum sp. PSN332]|nr:hypothetical protein QBC44DRAFT_83098 [Cladorrhinum sp. PSN332]
MQHTKVCDCTAHSGKDNPRVFWVASLLHFSSLSLPIVGSSLSLWPLMNLSSKRRLSKLSHSPRCCQKQPCMDSLSSDFPRLLTHRESRIGWDKSGEKQQQAWHLCNAKPRTTPHQKKKKKKKIAAGIDAADVGGNSDGVTRAVKQWLLFVAPDRTIHFLFSAGQTLHIRYSNTNHRFAPDKYPLFVFSFFARPRSFSDPFSKKVIASEVLVIWLVVWRTRLQVSVAMRKRGRKEYPNEVSF